MRIALLKGANKMFEYNMSAVLAKDLLKSRKGSDRKLSPQKYLIKYVNENCGLKYKVVKVYTTL